MARAKLRRIVVDGQEYLWRFTTSSKRDSSGEWKCHDEFVAYATGCKLAPLQVTFVTWCDPIAGGPLRTGLPVVLGDDTTRGIVMHLPRQAARLIQAARACGWNPGKDGAPWLVEDGIPLLLSLPREGG